MKKLIITPLLAITQLFAVTYDYDELNRLTKATYADSVMMHYAYDDGGNLLSVVSEGISIQDADGDGIPDDVESRLGLDPNSADSDGDGISDMDEVGDINHPRDSDGDGTIDALEDDSDGDGMKDADELRYGFDYTDPSDASQDSDGDGVSNLDEIKAGTDPRVGTVATLALASIDDIYVGKNANIPPVKLEGNASNGAEVSFDARSSDTDVVVTEVNDNLLTLSPLSYTEGDADITVTMSASGVSTDDIFHITVRDYRILVQDSSGAGYYSTTRYGYKNMDEETDQLASADDDGHVSFYMRIGDSTSRVNVNMAGGVIKINNNQSASIKLPTHREVEISVDPSGRVEPHIQDMVIPSDKLPLGTEVEMDEHAVDIVLPLPDRLRF